MATRGRMVMFWEKPWRFELGHSWLQETLKAPYHLHIYNVLVLVKPVVNLYCSSREHFSLHSIYPGKSLFPRDSQHLWSWHHPTPFTTRGFFIWTGARLPTPHPKNLFAQLHSSRQILVFGLLISVWPGCGKQSVQLFLLLRLNLEAGIELFPLTLSPCNAFC
jgi:hypothetical protein